MKLLKQPVGSSTCGQTCVAMIAGVPVKEVISFMGHKRATHMKELIKALSNFGVDCAMQVTQFEKGESYTFPPVCLVQIRSQNNRKGHYVIHYEGRFFDPNGTVHVNEQALFTYHKNYWVRYIVPIHTSSSPLTDDDVKKLNQSIPLHIIECTNCGHQYKRMRKTKLMSNLDAYWCHKCGREGGKLVYKGILS